MQKYKSLEDLGVRRQDCYTNWITEVNSPDREDKWKSEREEYGIDERETWNWSDDFMDYMYIHLDMFNKVNCVDYMNEYETIEFEGNKMYIQEAIDEILKWMKERYYPSKEDTIDIYSYENTDEGNKKYTEDLKQWMNEKHRIVKLFAEIIERLNW